MALHHGNMITLEKQASASDILASIIVGGCNKNVALTLRSETGKDEITHVAVEAIEELLNELFKRPDLLIKVFERYPHTHNLIRYWFTNTHLPESDLPESA